MTTSLSQHTAQEPRVLEDGRVTLRPPRPEDAADHAEAARESWREVGRWLPWCHAGYGEDDARRWIESAARGWETGEVYEWLIFEGERFVGGIALRPLGRGARVANCSYWLRTSAAGRGTMRRALALVLAAAWKHLDLQRIEILIEPENLASIHVAEAAGATYEGRLRNRLAQGPRNVDALSYAAVPPQ